MKEIWFKRKSYGWGWVPVTWQGWLVIGIYLLFVFGNVARVDKNSHSVSDTVIGSVVMNIIATIVLIGICFLMGEAPKWQWGENDRTTKKKNHAKKTHRRARVTSRHR